jgi:hypothetical protein
MGYPRLIHHGDAIAGVIDEVDQEAAPEGLVQPAVDVALGAPACRLLECRDGTVRIGPGEEEIQILGVAVDARVVGVGVRASHDEGDARFLQEAQGIGPGIEFLRLAVYLGQPRLCPADRRGIALVSLHAPKGRNSTPERSQSTRRAGRAAGAQPWARAAASWGSASPTRASTRTSARASPRLSPMLSMPMGMWCSEARSTKR